MKKILVFYSLIVFYFGFSQCYIQGNDTVKVSGSEMYSVTNSTAECADCYSWEIIGDNATFDGEVKQSSVRILPKNGGTFILTATLKSAKGNKQCSKNIQISNNFGVDAEGNSSGCDITWIGYKETKNTESDVIFESLVKNDDEKISWTVTYANGDEKTANVTSPHFNYSKENGIAKVVTKISTAKCTRTFTKNYDTTFWKYF